MPALDGNCLGGVSKSNIRYISKKFQHCWRQSNGGVNDAARAAIHLPPVE